MSTEAKGPLISKVNTPPRALQFLLGNVNQGINPHDLDGVVQPIVDLYPHYTTAQLRQEISSASIAGTVGQGLTILVPEGEVWQVVACSVMKDVAFTGTWQRIMIGIQDPRLAAPCWIAVDEGTTPGISLGRSAAAIALPDRFLLPPGWGIRGEVGAATSNNNTTMTVNVTYVRFEI